MGLALFHDRAWEMYRYRMRHGELVERIFSLVTSGEVKEAKAIWGDAGVPYGTLVEILDTCRKAALTNVVLMVRPRRVTFFSQPLSSSALSGRARSARTGEARSAA